MPVTMPRTAAEYRSYLADLLAEVHGQMRRHEKLLAGAWLICTELMTWHSTANLLHKYETPTAVSCSFCTMNAFGQRPRLKFGIALCSGFGLTSQQRCFS